ncbi:hypothetical protein [Alienimonas sp. DA493]|uniref:hypothetical protein n=1 Tax=Alienimonas sp. DA493 TaxID=3373605 RepID=UPI003754A4EF
MPTDAPAFDPAKLRELLDAANRPLPWTVEYRGHYDEWDVNSAAGDMSGINRGMFEGEPTAQLVAAAVNALPALLDRSDRLEAAEREAGELRETVRRLKFPPPAHDDPGRLGDRF